MLIVLDNSPPAASNDLALAQRAARDRAAFGAFYERYLPSVYRYLLARVGSVVEAEEVAAQTFEVALRSIGRFDGRSSLATWLLGIARHKAADHFRRARPTLPLAAAADLPDGSPTLDEVAARGLWLEQLPMLMRGLAPDRAEALSLRLFGGLSAAEAAVVMGKSEAAVKMLVHRAVKDLQARIAPPRKEEQ